MTPSIYLLTKHGTGLDFVQWFYLAKKDTEFFSTQSSEFQFTLLKNHFAFTQYFLRSQKKNDELIGFYAIFMK